MINDKKGPSEKVCAPFIISVQQNNSKREKNIIKRNQRDRNLGLDATKA